VGKGEKVGWEKEGVASEGKRSGWVKWEGGVGWGKWIWVGQWGKDK
jgi:hypothetical protein